MQTVLNIDHGFVTPERKKHPVFVCHATQTILSLQQDERVSRLIRTPEIFTPQMTLRQSSIQKRTHGDHLFVKDECSDIARVIGRDSHDNLNYLEVSHKKLNELYRDILPDRLKTHFSDRQVDAFHLYLFSSDLQYIYQKYASSVECVGDVQVVRFRGKFYRFDKDQCLQADTSYN